MTAFRPGGVFLEQSKKWIGKAVRNLTRTLGEASARTNHTGLFNEVYPTRTTKL